MKIRGKRACFSFWCVIKFACYVICIGSHTCHIKICRGTSKPIAKLFVMYVVLSKLYYVYSIVLIYQISYTLTEYFVHFNSKKNNEYYRLPFVFPLSCTTIHYYYSYLIYHSKFFITENRMNFFFLNYTIRIIFSV